MTDVEPRPAWLHLATCAESSASFLSHALWDVECFTAVVWRATLPGQPVTGWHRAARGEWGGSACPRAVVRWLRTQCAWSSRASPALRGVYFEFFGAAFVPAVGGGLEDGAAYHLALVDVYGDGQLVFAGVTDGVVLVWGNQAAGAAAVAYDAWLGAEAETVAVPLQQFVLGDLQLAEPDAFHTPQAAVVVQRRALPRAPAHGDDAVAVFRAAVELAAGVVVFHRLVHAGGKLDAAVGNGLAQRGLQYQRDAVRVVVFDGVVNGGDETVAAMERREGAGRVHDRSVGDVGENLV